MNKCDFEPTYLEITDREDVAVVAFRVPFLSEDYNLEQLGHELFVLVEQCGCRRLVVSLRDIQYTTSSGLGKLITLHRKLHRLGGQVAFCDLRPRILETMQMSKLDTYFQITPDVETAVAAVSACEPDRITTASRPC